MLTCFVRTEYFDPSQTVTLIMFLLIPAGFILYSVFLSFRMCCNKKLHGDMELSRLFYKYISFISVNFILNTPMCILYILTLNIQIEKNTFLSWLSFVIKKIIFSFLVA